MTPTVCVYRHLVRAGILLLWITTAVSADVVTFRQGDNGYTGTVDTFIQEDPESAGIDNGTFPVLTWDDDDPNLSEFDLYTLIRFDDIFGPGGVPPGAQITEATLYLTVLGHGDHGRLHPILIPWTAQSTYNSFCGVFCGQGQEFGPQESIVPATIETEVAVSVTDSVQAWSDGAPNHGWIIRPQFGGCDGADIWSSDHTAPEVRPRLEIRHGEGVLPVTLVRGPYLQMAGPTTMTILWSTDEPTDTVLQYGLAPDALDQSVTMPAVVVKHQVQLNDLQPATTYYYSVGSSETVIAGGDEDHSFTTPPPTGDPTPFRAWIVGDSGTGNEVPMACRDAMLSVAAGDLPDLFLHMGDIAYESGTEDEFTLNLFGMFSPVLRHAPIWPTFGNHDADSSTSLSESGPYYNAFVLPRAGEFGGLASGTEAYYSFDYGNVHFVCLNSQDVPRNPGSAMLTWLEQDLADTLQDWIIAFWHHPPYSKGSHDSDDAGDSGGRLVDMREDVLPILDEAGVDLVLSGHSHNYERSLLIDGVYGYGSFPNYPTPPYETLLADGRILDPGNGAENGDGAYHKHLGLPPHQGIVYVVAGHAGTETEQQGVHPVMAFVENDHGSCLLDVDGNSLTLINIRQDGQITDTFSLVKVACRNDADCLDDHFCNGAEFCDGGGICRPGRPACGVGTSCNEAQELCVPVTCGNGTCQTGEDCVNCASDCDSAAAVTCGNMICETADGEDCLSCPVDCNGEQSGTPEDRFCCGGGAGENPVTCDDPRCTDVGFDCTDQIVVPYCCGDGECEGPEDALNCDPDCGQPHPCDDGVINAADLAILLGNWGPCPGCAVDLIADGVVNAGDLAVLLGSWGPCLP